MSECKLCGKNEENLTLLSADHKEMGWIMICQTCWVKLYEENAMVSGKGSGSSGTCPTCR
jgi:protein-arginine kinase activator protein McsA